MTCEHLKQNKIAQAIKSTEARNRGYQWPRKIGDLSRPKNQIKLKIKNWNVYTVCTCKINVNQVLCFLQ